MYDCHVREHVDLGRVKTRDIDSHQPATIASFLFLSFFLLFFFSYGARKIYSQMHVDFARQSVN
jgi:hypothetical protein